MSLDPLPCRPALLLAGSPGIGKSTVIQRLVARLGPAAGGFYTSEVRQGGKRVGFEIVTLAGRRDYLVTADPAITFVRAAPFGRYRVNLEAIDTFVVPALRQAAAEDQVVILDEIGPMELLSPLFGEVVLELLNGPALIVGTIVQRRHPLADLFKTHPRVSLVEVTPANRDQLAAQLYAAIRAAGGKTGISG
ncbi:MAG: nucleoside-triphosphatase [Chloroflexota bacterium]